MCTLREDSIPCMFVESSLTGFIHRFTKNIKAYQFMVNFSRILLLQPIEPARLICSYALTGNILCKHPRCRLTVHLQLVVGGLTGFAHRFMKKSKEVDFTRPLFAKSVVNRFATLDK